MMCLVLTLCVVGCGKKQETTRTSPPPAEKAQPLVSASRPTDKTPRFVDKSPQPAHEASPLVNKSSQPIEKTQSPIDEAPKSVAKTSTSIEKSPQSPREAPPSVAEAPPPAKQDPESVTKTSRSVEEERQTVTKTSRSVEEERQTVTRTSRSIKEAPSPAPRTETDDETATVAARPLDEEDPAGAGDPAVLERVAALESDDAAAHTVRPQVATLAEECEQALRQIRQARRTRPGDVALRLEEARMSRRCGQPRRALDLLLDLDAESRASQEIAHEIAEAFRMLQDPGKAAMAWELRYIVHPTAWGAAVRAAEAWLEADEHKPAWWWYEKARLAAPGAPDVQALATVFQSASASDR
jgi:hypothetical protein